jgi:CheY-like chemotaxis protein
MSDGSLRDAYLSLTTTVSEGVVRSNVIVADLTELVGARSERDRAERENRAKDEFMAMLAHELRNPIDAISSAIQVLDAPDEEASSHLRARDVVGRQVRHLSRLVDDLLDASRVVTGKIELDRRPIDCGELVGRVIRGMERQGLLNRSIDIKTEPVWADADPVRVEQIVTNLVGNAIKYTQPDGTIRVSLTGEGEDAVLRVEDDGAGIPADLLPRIFDLFVQGDQSLDRGRGGLGIGLTLVRLLAARHGGSVRAASDGTDRGSVFTVRLPRTAAQEQRPTKSIGARGPRRRVLLIEDNQDAREMHRLILEHVGHDVLEADDGISGFELLKSDRPEIAFVDIGLPGLDGYEVARRFRREPDNGDTVLVALSGYGSSEYRERSTEAGFDYYLVKPASVEAIHRILAGDVAAKDSLG